MLNKLLGLIVGGIMGYGVLWTIEPNAMFGLSLIFVVMGMAVGFAITSGKKNSPMVPRDF